MKNMEPVNNVPNMSPAKAKETLEQITELHITIDDSEAFIKEWNILVNSGAMNIVSTAEIHKKS